MVSRTLHGPNKLAFSPDANRGQLAKTINEDGLVWIKANACAIWFSLVPVASEVSWGGSMGDASIDMEWGGVGSVRFLNH